MKTESSKQTKRKENKKKKMKALISVAQLNEDDLKKDARKNSVSSNEYTDGSRLPRKKLKTEHSNEDVIPNGVESTTTSLPELIEVASTSIQADSQDYKSLQKDVKEIRQRKKHPKVYLKIPGNQSSLSMHVDDRIPLLLTDIQHLLLFSILGLQSPYQPTRWCKLDLQKRVSHTLVLVVEGVSLYHYVSHESLFVNTNKRFENRMEVITPSLYGGSIIDELAAVPLTDMEKEDLIKEYGSMDAAMEYRKDLMVMLRAVFPVSEGLRPKLSSDTILEDKFPRTQLILSAWQLLEENFPLPLKGKLKNAYSEYVMTKDVYDPVTSTSPMFGLDCEMCQTRLGSELTRVSVIDENHKTVYESLVLPYNKIVDYVTRFSGINAAMLKNVTTRLEDVQKALREILPANAILVGQSLNFDLHALKMIHPYVIDTSVIFNVTGEKNRKSKLKILAKMFLDKDIQGGSQGHCSIEDSITSLELVQLKLKNDLIFGDKFLSGRKDFQDNYSHLTDNVKEYSTSLFNKVSSHEMTCNIVGCESTTTEYSDYFKLDSENLSDKKKFVKMFSCDSNSKVVKKTCKLVESNDLTLSHVRIEEEDLEKPETFTKIDNWINDIWLNAAIDSLVVLIFSGDKNCNGVSFVDIKKVMHKI